jgi:hypothetical protein
MSLVKCPECLRLCFSDSHTSKSRASLLFSVQAKIAPNLDPLRSEEQFQALVKKLGFPQYLSPLYTQI